MSRKERSTKKTFKVFCEGGTEYNYIDELRRQKKLSIALKMVNMKGGGYRSFIVNHYSVNKTKYEIKVKSVYNWEKLGRKGSNINEFFEVIGCFDT